jgi:PAS domain S-box-containing protein
MERQKERSLAARYLTALLAPLVVAGAMQLTWPFFEQSPTALFLLAVMFSAWYGGLAPGLLSVLVSFLLADYFFVAPYFALWPPRQGDIVYLVTLATVGSFISVLSELMQRARQRAESSLDITKRSEDMYRSLVTTTSQIIWNTDAEGQIVMDVPAWRDITGQSFEEMKGKGWIDALHPRDRERLGEIWSEAALAATPFETEGQIRQRDGSYRNYLIRGVPVFKEDGVTVREWVETASDITERKRGDERFKMALEAAPNPMVMINSEGKIVFTSSQMETLFGYSREELFGQRIEVLVPERFRRAHPGYRSGFFMSPQARPMGIGRDLYGRHKDGREIPVEIGLNPMKIEEETFVLASIIDITERKRADGALRDSEARLAGIVNSAMDAIITVDGEQHILLFNTAAEKMFRCSADDAIEKPVDRFIPARFRDTHPSHIQSFGQTGVTTRAMAGARAVYGRRADGEEFPVEASISQVEAGGQKFYTVILRDITERERAEERFRQVIEGAPNGMVMVDGEGKIVLVNAQIEKSFGYSRNELLGQRIEMLVPERFRAYHPAYRNSFTDAPSARSMGSGRDLYGLRKDGSEFPVEIGLNPLETEQGMMVLGTVVDITERKQAEETLRRSQEQLAGVIGSAMDAIISVDEEQRIVLFNAAAERMFLYPAEDAIGQPLDRFIPERFRSTHKEHIQDFGRTHVTRRAMGALGALYGLRADGEEFPIEASISQIEADGRKLYTVILRDITERKRSEEALKEQARILDLAPVLIRDLSGRILFWNSGSEQMYGWKQEEALEKITHHLLKTEFTRPLEEIKARLFADGHWEGELVHTRRDGERIVVASHWVLHRDEQGKPKAILEVNNDITERKQAEKEIRRLNEELEQRVTDRTAQLQAANKELEAFSYSVSHDLRAPLRHINGFSQALLEDYADNLDKVGKSYLQEVRDASQEMAQLIDDVLQLARVTRSEMRREVVNLSEVAHAVIAELQKREPERSVAINLKEGLSAHGDKRLLKIMLTNLLGNAWKFTSKQEQAEITLGCERNDGETFYFVRDNGAGFDMTYVNKLFGAFQRLHTAGEFEGTGIGLATVQRIINRHGGRVWAEGTVNEGATFCFTLPDFKEIKHE